MAQQAEGKQGTPVQPAPIWAQFAVFAPFPKLLLLSPKGVKLNFGSTEHLHSCYPQKQSSQNLLHPQEFTHLSKKYLCCFLCSCRAALQKSHNSSTAWPSTTVSSRAVSSALAAAGGFSSCTGNSHGAQLDIALPGQLQICGQCLVSRDKTSTSSSFSRNCDSCWCLCCRGEVGTGTERSLASSSLHSILCLLSTFTES